MIHDDAPDARRLLLPGCLAYTPLAPPYAGPRASPGSISPRIYLARIYLARIYLAPTGANTPAGYMPQTFYLVDGHSLLFTAYHAIEPLSAPDGAQVGAVYGFLRSLRRMIASHAPDYLTVVFDAPQRTFRHEVLDVYKANRPAAPADFGLQLRRLEGVLAAWPIKTVQMPGYEADDVLATMAQRFAGEQLKIVIVTSDKDCRQLLVDDRIEIFDLRRDSFLTAKKLLERDGLRPDQIVDFLTMVGDSSDNVPGIPLIGKQKAKALLTRYGSLDAVLENSEQVPGKTGENLRTARATVPTMRHLLTLCRDVPIDLVLSDCTYHKPTSATLTPVLRQLGFNRLISELGITERPVERNLHFVSDSETLIQLEEELQGITAIAIRLVWSGNIRHPMIHGLALSWQDYDAWYLPLGNTNEPLRVASWRIASTLLGPHGPLKIGHGLGDSHQALATASIDLAPIGCDTQLACYLLAPVRSDFSLMAVAASYLGITLDLDPVDDPGGLFFDLELEARAHRAGNEAETIWRLYQLLAPQLERRGLAHLLQKVELPLLAVLSRMEAAGIAIDLTQLADLAELLTSEIETHRTRCHELAGVAFNPDSPRQLAELLFDTLRLPAQRRTKTGYSTDAGVLEELAQLHPLPAAVLAYRQLVKLQNTYIDTLPRLVDRQTGRIHTHYNQVGAVTGRLACERPNLQNIPIRTPLGRRIRRAFIAAPAKKLLAADYSQVELRILAHTSGDPVLSAAFAQGLDIHRAVASRITGLPEDQIDSDMRRRAKTVNFGIIYGQTPFGLARELGISQADARAFIDRYFDQFPDVRLWIETCIQQARRDGEVRTLLGRVRQLPEITSHNFNRRAFAERTAVNTVIQGTAADLIKLAMIRLDTRIRQERLPGCLLLSIHDELLLEIDPAFTVEICAIVRDEMARALELSVPLVVDIGYGDDWLAAGEKLDPGTTAKVSA